MARWVAIAGGAFRMGSDRHYPEEGPSRRVEVAPFEILEGPVTNRDFAAFVRATGYVTLAERADAAGRRAGALVFTPPAPDRPARDWRDWWRLRAGASWKRPDGGASVVPGRLDHPVVCLAFADVRAYAAFAGAALPDEAQWELAARGGLEGATYAWGEARRPGGEVPANVWTGRFPRENLAPKRRRGTSPVGAFPPNGFGLLDMIGNVWEWTSTPWGAPPGAPAPTAAACCAGPAGADAGLRVVKGGSHLCHESYCDRYRPAARQPQAEDTAAVHLGFRLVRPRPDAG